MYALKTLFDQPFRFGITAAGIALCVVLMLFLSGIYKGVSDGSVEYIRASDVDIWVLQRHTNNIMRSTSLLRSKYWTQLEDMEGIASVSPVIFVLGAVELPNGPQSLYLTGFDPETGKGGPPEIITGRNVKADNEIVLDQAFACKNDVQVGDSLILKNDTLTVVGLSNRTNMIVIQYAFVTLTETHRILGFSGIVSCFLVKLEPGVEHKKIVGKIGREVPDAVAFDRDTFLLNNIREMESGILPLLFLIALLGSVVLTAILSLILSINVLERRKDFAVMKALGAPPGFVPGMVLLQSFVLAVSGLLLGILAFFPLMRIVVYLVPEVSVVTSWRHLVSVSLGVWGISLISSVFPIRKLRKVYPLEVFK